MIVVDTDVLVDCLRGHSPSESRVRSEIAAGRLRTTAVSRFELMSGAHRPHQLASVRALLGAIPALALDSDAADRAASLRRLLDAKGIGIGMADSLIAGITLSNGCELLTRNRRHFERVPDLRLASPE